MFRGRLVIVPGWRMKAVHVGSRLLPDRLLMRLAWHMQSRKTRGTARKRRNHEIRDDWNKLDYRSVYPGSADDG